MPAHPPLIARLGLTALCAAALALPACAGRPAGDATFRIGLGDDLKTFDPAVGYDVPSWAAERLVFAGLVTYDAAGRVVNELAERVEASPDARAFTFRLRPGLRFHDGAPLSARDVVHTFERLLDPATRSPGAGFYADLEGAPERLKGERGAPLGVIALDDRTVRFRLARPNAIFLQLLAMPFASVVPAHVPSGSLARAPVGAGPFKLTRWRSGLAIDLARFDGYFGPQPAWSGVHYELGVSESLEALKFERGWLDLIGANRNVGASEYVRLASQPTTREERLTAPDVSFNYITLNCELKPFTDVRVRRAIAMAVDKARIVRLVNGRGVPAKGILPPTMPGFDPALAGIPHDPAGAKALLAEAGYPQGFETTYYCVGSPTALKVAQALQADLAKVGVRITLKPLAFPTYLQAKATRRTVPMGSGNWSQDFPDPSNFLATMFASKNISDTNSLNDSYYSNPRVDAWLEEASRTLDAGKRVALYRKAEAAIVADAAVVPLYNPVKAQFVGPRLGNYRMHAVFGFDLTGTTRHAR